MNRGSAAVIVVAAAALLSLLYSYFIEPSFLFVNSYEISVKDLSSAADGLRIVAIGDIHAGSNGVDQNKLRKIVERANAADPDLIVLLGDYISEKGRRDTSGNVPLKMELPEFAAGISGLKARYGVFAVLGNHDNVYGKDAVIAALKGCGYNVLDGAVATFERNGEPIRILGLKDHLQVGNWAAFAEASRQLLARSGTSGDIIVLEHGPDVAPIITGSDPISNDLKLMLAAHTHGGQIRLPILGRPLIPSSYGQKFAAGHVIENGLDVFVTTGIGESVFPLRFMVPPEIAVITLKNAT